MVSVFCLSFKISRQRSKRGLIKGFEVTGNPPHKISKIRSGIFSSARYKTPLNNSGKIKRSRRLAVVVSLLVFVVMSPACAKPASTGSSAITDLGGVSSATGIDATGDMVVGYFSPDGASGHAFRWTQATAWSILERLRSRRHRLKGSMPQAP